MILTSLIVGIMTGVAFYLVVERFRPFLAGFRYRLRIRREVKAAREIDNAAPAFDPTKYRPEQWKDLRMSQRVEETEVNNIIFVYKIGITHTAISTKEKDQWSAAIPDHFKMSFMIDTPPGFWGGDNAMREDQITDVIKKAIREKADEQKRTGSFCKMTITERQTKARSRR